MAQIQLIKPADLLIDEENPRIAQPNEGQHRALQQLAELLGTKLLALAAHIVKHGINPADLPIVMALPGRSGRYTVLEGNRRIAALRALENPDSISGAAAPTVLKKIRELSKDYHENPVEDVNCVVVKDRVEAAPWIELRHTGENAGAGLVPWGHEESNRFKSRAGKVPSHIQALDFLQARGALTPDVRRRLPATSFKRLIDTPAVKSKLALEVKDGLLHLLGDPEPTAKALARIVTDLVVLLDDGKPRIKTADIYTAEDRRRYAAKFPKDLVVKPNAQAGGGSPVSKAPPATNLKRRPKTAAGASKKRDRLIPQDCVLGIPPGRINDIELELRRYLSLSDHTNSVSVMFRVFVELSLDAYVERNPIPGLTDMDKLGKKIELVSLDLQTRRKLTKQQGAAVRSVNSGNSLLAPETSRMHDYVHNPYIFPEPSDLRQHWNTLQAFVAAVWST